VNASVRSVAKAHQRVDGEARIAFRRRADGVIALADLYQRAPCRVLFPTTEAGEPLQAVLLTTSGGLTGGDRTRVSVSVEPSARATLTTQAAEKIYRALPNTGDAVVQVEMQVGDGAWAEWLAQETIVFEGSRLRRLFAADVAATGQLLAVESIVFGRTAMGETFNSGMLHDAWRISRGGRLIWADALHLDGLHPDGPHLDGPHLDGDIRRLRAMPFGFGTSVACSTILYAGADAPQQLATARRLLSDCALSCGATSLDGIMLVRIMADDASELRAAVMKLIAGIRQAAAALPAQLPRLWHC
jgi:urease accessory protein